MIPQINVKGLTLFPTDQMSRKEWLVKRQDGVGGSDLSSILGLNKHFSVIDLFYQKIGMTFDASEQTNAAMFWGSQLEDHVLDKAQYLDLETGEYLDNYLGAKKVREISKVPYMVSNPDFPWILANLDGAVNLTKYDDGSFDMDAIAEAKTISRMTADIWENRFPIYHLVQITTYAMVCAPLMRGEPQAYIFYLEDGREFRGFHIPRMSDEMMDNILTSSRDFWQRVQKGREIIANTKDTDRRVQFLADIEPEPDNTEGYEKFMSKLFLLKKEFKTINGAYDDLINARAYLRIKKEIDELDVQRQGLRNRIIRTLHKNGANIIDFGKIDGKPVGKITYNKKLYVNIK